MTMRVRALLVAGLVISGSAFFAQSVVSAAPAKGGKAGKRKAKASGDDDDDDDDDDDELDKEINLRNIVKTATKSETTVQEAPTVINVITSEEIESFGFRNILMVMRPMPGFLESSSQNDVIPLWTIRGITQAGLFMKDGLSLFDPIFNVVPTPRRIPMENIRRIEVMSAPGGVLWGANSFLGIVNVITKDAEDVKGFELGFGGGHGDGDAAVMRPYLMYGGIYAGGKLKVFAHVSAEFFRGPIHSVPKLLIFSPPPRVNGPALYSRAPFNETSETDLSLFFQFDGKITWIPKSNRSIQLAWQWTFSDFGGRFGGLATGVSVLGNPVRTSPVCPPGLRPGSPGCDRILPAIKRNNINWHNSFIYVRYKDRFAKNRVGLNMRGFYTRFDRQFKPIVAFPRSPNVLDGLAFNNTAIGHRAGFTLDMDFKIHRTFKLLVGGEGFYEWVKDANVKFTAPLDLNGQFQFNKLPLICPFIDRNGSGLPIYDPGNPSNTNYVPGCKQNFIFDSDRAIFAGFLSAQFRPVKRLTLDAGVRVQAAPIGNVGYDPVVLYSGAAVVRIWKTLFFKANYSTGFRAPIFNNTSGNPAAVEYAGNRNIKSEFSESVTAELNAKLMRNKGRVRQWDVRADYSWTRLRDRIVILSGSYENVRGFTTIHSVEFLSRLYLRGGHVFYLAYTYLRSQAPGEVIGGTFRSIPNHWFTLAASFNVLRRGSWVLDLNTSIRVLGAFEDPNRVPNPDGSAPTSNLAFDRIPPAANFTLGARLRTKLGRYPFELKANFYNVLNGNFSAIDPNFATAPRTEMQPVPRQRFYFFVQAKFRLPVGKQ